MPKSLENKNLPRDVFLYLLSIIALVSVAISFGTILFQYINYYFPDIVSDPYGAPFQYTVQMRSALAALIVFFPVYVWIVKFLKKDISANPEKRELKIRKWLLYLTLFASGLAIIIDLIFLLNNFLEGELTLRFALKVLSVLFIAGSIFYYYINELREAKNVNEGRLKAFSWFIVAVVIASVVAAFFLIGSPMKQRLIKLDERRVNDLQYIQSQVVSYWQSKEKLPQTLDEMRNDITGVSVPVDPQTGSAYGYEVLGNLKFSLCADFATKSGDVPGGYPKYRYSVPAPDYLLGNATWDHEAGKICFERTIDPEIIKPFEKPIR